MHPKFGAAVVIAVALFCRSVLFYHVSFLFKRKESSTEALSRCNASRVATLFFVAMLEMFELQRILSYFFFYCTICRKMRKKLPNGGTARPWENQVSTSSSWVATAAAAASPPRPVSWQPTRRSTVHVTRRSLAGARFALHPLASRPVPDHPTIADRPEVGRQVRGPERRPEVETTPTTTTMTTTINRISAKKSEKTKKHSRGMDCWKLSDFRSVDRNCYTSGLSC